MKSYRIFLCFLSAIFFLMSFCPASFASVTLDAVYADIQRPVASYFDDGTTAHLICNFVVSRSDSGIILYVFDVSAPTGSRYLVYSGHDQGAGIYCDHQVTSGIMSTFNALTGSFLSSGGMIINNSGSVWPAVSGYPYRAGLSGYWPKTLNTDSGLRGFYVIGPDNQNVSYDNTAPHYSNDFIVWDVPQSTNVIRSSIPQPLSDVHHMYIADRSYLYQINIAYPSFYSSSGLYASNIVASDFFEQVYLSFAKSDVNTVNIDIINRSTESFWVYISKYNVLNGEYISTANLLISAMSNGDPTEYIYPLTVIDAMGYGLWYTGLLNADGLIAFDKLQISWSDTIDYTQDLCMIESLINTYATQMIDQFGDISRSLSALYQIVDFGWSWLRNDYYNAITGKLDLSNQYLLSIYNLLVDNGETITIESDTSGIAAMDDAKNQLTVVDQSGNVVDPAQAAEDNFSVAASEIGDLAEPVSVVNGLMQSIVFRHTKLLLPIIVALALGLLVTIMGKNVSG